MPESKHRIIFTGKLVAGIEPRQALENLAKLFNKSPQEIQQAFKGGAVINRGIPAGKVEQALAALRRAGVECRAEPVVAMQAEPPGEAEPATRSSRQPAPTEVNPETEAVIGKKPASEFRVLDIAEANADLTLSPVNCNRVAGGDEGLVTNRMDRALIPLHQVVLAAVFTLQEEPENYKLLIYSVGQKRPLAVDVSQISFSDFPGVPGASLYLSLCNFIRYLAEHSDGFMIDRATDAFLNGGKPRVCNKDPLLLSCSLYQAISQVSPDLVESAGQMKPAAAPISISPVDSAVSSSSGAVDAVPDAAPPAPETVKMIGLFEQVVEWSRGWLLLSFGLSLLGFVLPLLKRSIILDEFFLIWPWNLMGLGIDGPKAASMATFSQGEAVLIYSLLPLLTTVGAGFCCFVNLRQWLPLIALLCGGAPLLAGLTLFHAEAEIFGIIHLPMSWEGGAMLFAVILTVVLIAAVNHIVKNAAPFPGVRILYGLGGVFLLLAAGLAMFASPWNNWALYLLYLLLIGIAGLAIKGGLKVPPSEETANLISLLLRVVLIWTPIAAITSQASYSDPFVTFVVESGGGVLPTVIAAVKCFAIHYAMAVTMAVGLTGLLAMWAERATPSLSPDD